MYPRKVILESPKLAEILKKKEPLVSEGRKISDEIETIEKEMEEIDKGVKEMEGKVDTSEIDAEAKPLTDQFNEIVKKMEELKKRLFEKLKAGIQPEMLSSYEEKKDKKEKLERERNKIALKVQKLNDKAIPITRSLMAPHIQDEFEDYESVKIEDGQVVGTIFSHLEELRTRLRSKK